MALQQEAFVIIINISISTNPPYINHCFVATMDVFINQIQKKNLNITKFHISAYNKIFRNHIKIRMQIIFSTTWKIKFRGTCLIIHVLVRRKTKVENASIY